jgi:hypothetical protein
MSAQPSQAEQGRYALKTSKQAQDIQQPIQYHEGIAAEKEKSQVSQSSPLMSTDGLKAALAAASCLHRKGSHKTHALQNIYHFLLCVLDVMMLLASIPTHVKRGSKHMLLASKEKKRAHYAVSPK